MGKINCIHCTGITDVFMSCGLDQRWFLTLGLHKGPNNLCYVTRHFLFFPYVTMSLFIRP